VTEAERNEYIRFVNDQYDLLITKIASDIVRDEAMVADVKQKVLIKLVPKVHILATLHPKQVAAYVSTTTRNVALSEYNLQVAYENHQEKLNDAMGRTFTMDYVEFKAFRGKYGFGEELWTLMMDLPARDRDILVYRYYYQMTSAEIAELMGTNREQVKKNYQRTRKKLIKMIEERGLELR